MFTSAARVIAGDPNRTFSPTTSTLIFGARDVVLVDALLIREAVDALGDMIASTGRTLTTIFITHGDGDHFLGSDRLIARFPGARAPTQEAPTPLMDTTFVRTAATRQVTAGAAEFGSATIRCSPFDEIFVETKSIDQRKYWAETFLASSIHSSSVKDTMRSRLPFLCRRLSGRRQLNGIVDPKASKLKRLRTE